MQAPPHSRQAGRARRHAREQCPASFPARRLPAFEQVAALGAARKGGASVSRTLCRIANENQPNAASARRVSPPGLVGADRRELWPADIFAREISAVCTSDQRQRQSV